MPFPNVEQVAVHFDRDRQIRLVDAEPTDEETTAMSLCLELADQALRAGNPPVGAILLDNKSGLLWGAQTIDKTQPHLIGHAETRAYLQAQPTVGDDLSEATLVTTAQPCNTCTTPYAEGKIGRIIYAMPRPVIFAVCGIMRPREINMPDLLRDGDTETTVIAGHQSQEALALFGRYAMLRGHEPQSVGPASALPIPMGWALMPDNSFAKAA